jgi:hypothetical protein
MEIEQVDDLPSLRLLRALKTLFSTLHTSCSLWLKMGSLILWTLPFWPQLSFQDPRECKKSSPNLYIDIMLI